MVIAGVVEMGQGFSVKKDQPVRPDEIESLRAAVGWDTMEGRYGKILPRLYAQYTVRENSGDLVGFLSVLSDGVGDAFLLDLMVRPDHQNTGIGSALVKQAIRDLKSAGVKCVQVLFDPELEPFFRRFGFHILRAGIIDNEAMDVDP
jgi:N-acetylglutamate synthase-like GNAT family acetyltransferase